MHVTQIYRCSFVKQITIHQSVFFVNKRKKSLEKLIGKRDNSVSVVLTKELSRFSLTFVSICYPVTLIVTTDCQHSIVFNLTKDIFLSFQNQLALLDITIVVNLFRT